MHRKLTLSMALLIAFGMTGTALAGSYTDGSFTGSAQGFGGDVTVEITVENGEVVNTEITGDSETPEVGGAALEELAQQITDAQSSEIQGVSGATLTSGAVKEAAAQAFSAALEGGETAAAETDADEETSLTPGTYTASASGYQGGVTVEVTIDETSITDITISELTDHPDTVAGLAAEKIPADILENQSVNVDSVTGATFTSMAIKKAVTDCLEQAGGASMFKTEVPEEAAETMEDENVDILVIGAGGAGFLAAAGAATYTDGSSTGLNVMVIDSLAYLGGSTGVAGGGFVSYSTLVDTQQEDWTDTAFEQEMELLQAFNENEVDAALLRSLIEHDEDLIKYLSSFDLTLTPLPGMGYIFIDENTFMDHDHWTGQNLTKAETAFFDQTDNIEYRLETTATGLLYDENGEICGASVTHNGSDYNIYASKVILCTGGFSQNSEMVEKYAPNYVGAIPFGAKTDQGAGFEMALEAGAQSVGDSLLLYEGVDNVEGMWDDFSGIFHYGAGISMDVNLDGKRFIDESASGNVEAALTIAQPEHMAWGIVDGDNADVAALETSASGYVVKADTISDLCALTGINEENLTETIAAYNQAINDGEDPAFGTAPEFMDAIETAPYYAFEIHPIALSSLVGVKTNDKCEIVNENGDAIPNLYGAGDVIFGGNLLTYYVGGRGIGTALHSGLIAGTQARDELLG